MSAQIIETIRTLSILEALIVIEILVEAEEDIEAAIEDRIGDPTTTEVVITETMALSENNSATIIMIKITQPTYQKGPIMKALTSPIFTKNRGIMKKKLPVIDGTISIQAGSERTDSRKLLKKLSKKLLKKWWKNKLSSR